MLKARDLLSYWDNFKKNALTGVRQACIGIERSCPEEVDTLLQDSINLLHFHNVLLHSKCLLEKPTLKHTLHLSALTVEGRVYEMGKVVPSLQNADTLWFARNAITHQNSPRSQRAEVQTKRLPLGHLKALSFHTKHCTNNSVS